jgi:hypothetical protein
MSLKPYVRHISRVVIASFLWMNIHTTAIAFYGSDELIRQEMPQYVIQTIMAPLVAEAIQQEAKQDISKQKEAEQRVAALKVLQLVGGIYQTIHLFNFLTIAATEAIHQAPQTPLVTNLSATIDNNSINKQQVYTGIIPGIGDFLVNEDGSLVFNGASRLNSIAFDTEKTLILDNLNAEKTILSTPKAILKSQANVGDLTLNLGGANDSVFQILENGVLQAKNIDIKGGHFLNAGKVEFSSSGSFQLKNGTIYNQGQMLSTSMLTIESLGLMNASGGIIKSELLNLTANNVFNHGTLDAQSLTAAIAGTLDNSGHITASNTAEIKAYEYKQTGEIKGNKAAITAQTLSLQGKFDIHDLNIDGNQVDILGRLQAQKLRFSGGTVNNMGSLHATRSLIFDNEKTLNKSGLVAEAGLTIAHEFINEGEMAISGETKVSGTLQNGTDKNNAATIAYDKVIFNNAIFINYGAAAFANSFGTLASLDLRAGNLGIQSADLTIHKVSHNGALSLNSGQIVMQTESIWNARLLELTSNQATLKSAAAMSFLVDSDVVWKQAGLVSAPIVTITGNNLTLKENGILEPDYLTLNLNKLKNENSTIRAKKEMNGSLKILENEDVIEARRLILPSLSVIKNSNHMSVSGFELQALTEFSNDEIFETKPLFGPNEVAGKKMTVYGAFNNTGVFSVRNLVLSAKKIVSAKKPRGTKTAKFLTFVSATIAADQSTFAGEFCAENLTINTDSLTTSGNFTVSGGMTTQNLEILETSGTFKVAQNLKVETLKTLTNTGEFAVPQITAPNLKTISNGGNFSTNSLNAGNLADLRNTKEFTVSQITAPNLRTISNSGNFATNSFLHLQKLQNFSNWGTWKSGAFDAPSLNSFQNSGTLTTISPKNYNCLIARDFSNTGELKLDGEIKAGYFENIGIMELPNQSSVSVTGKFVQTADIIGEKLTVSASNVNVIPKTAVYSGTNSLTLNFGSTGRFLSSVTNKGKILAKVLTYNGPKLNNSGTLSGTSSSHITGGLSNSGNAVLQNLTLGEFSGGTLDNSGELKIEGYCALKNIGILNSGTMILNTNAQTFSSLHNSWNMQLGRTSLEIQSGASSSARSGITPGTTYPEEGGAYKINGTFSTSEDAVTFYQGAHVIANDFNEDGVTECNGKMYLYGNATKWGRIKAPGGVEWKHYGANDLFPALNNLTVEMGSLHVKTSAYVNFNTKKELSVPFSLDTTSDVAVSNSLIAPKIDINCRNFTFTGSNNAIRRLERRLRNSQPSYAQVIESTNAPLTIHATNNLSIGGYNSVCRYSGKYNHRDTHEDWSKEMRPTNHSGTRKDYRHSWTDYSYENPSADYKARTSNLVYAPYGLTLTSGYGIDLSYCNIRAAGNLNIQARNGNIMAEGSSIEHIGDATLEANRCTIKKTTSMKEISTYHSESCYNNYSYAFWWFASGDWSTNSNSKTDTPKVSYYPLGDDSILSIKGNLTIISRNSITIDGAQVYVERNVSCGGRTANSTSGATSLGFFSLTSRSDSVRSVLVVGQTVTINANSGTLSGTINANGVSLTFRYGLQLIGSDPILGVRGDYLKALPDILGATTGVFHPSPNNSSTALVPRAPLRAPKGTAAFINEAGAIAANRGLRQHYELGTAFNFVQMMFPQLVGIKGFGSGFFQRLCLNGINALRQGWSLSDVVRAGQSAVFLAPGRARWGEQVMDTHIYIPAKERNQLTSKPGGIYTEGENDHVDISVDEGSATVSKGYHIHADGPIQLYVRDSYLTLTHKTK